MRSLLIANRGEIALRIARTATRLGIRTVAVYSDADSSSPHVSACDFAVHLPGVAPNETYGNAKAILAAVAKSQADAVHPGYGFLAENPDFVAACARAGVAFVGPKAEAVRIMADKGRAKLAMRAADVPVVPGYDGEKQDASTLEREARRLGFPLLVKAAAGGGGRGMREVSEISGLASALESARREARSAFGDDRLILEKKIVGARHIEVQVIGDGERIHTLFERECSVQRRHQKVIEEAPSPAVDPELRATLTAIAVRVAEAVDYENAGTVEMLVGDDRSPYFIEMNTRLQVEHPVTEGVSGLDLVELQFRVAMGEKLDSLPIAPVGHSIEARLYAEDPDNGFAAQTGVIDTVSWPSIEGVRIDSGIRDGYLVGMDYDSMLAKLVSTAPNRELARKRLVLALERTAIVGVRTNQRYLVELLEDDEFVDGRATTAWLDTRPTQVSATPQWLVAIAALELIPGRASVDSLGRSLDLEIDGERHTVFLGAEDGDLVVTTGDFRASAAESDGFWTIDGVRRNYRVARRGRVLLVSAGGFALAVRPWRRKTHDEGGTGRVVAPMNGKIIRLPVALGSTVERSTVVATLEAMKMEHDLVAGVSGRLVEVFVREGVQVGAREVVARVEPDNE